jgi:hypothetical protein
VNGSGCFFSNTCVTGFQVGVKGKPDENDKKGQQEQVRGTRKVE